MFSPNQIVQKAILEHNWMTSTHTRTIVKNNLTNAGWQLTVLMTKSSTRNLTLNGLKNCLRGIKKSYYV
jgi:hypothetical protein